MKSDNDVVRISIPTSLAKKLEGKIKGTKFESISNYVVFLLEEFLAESERKENTETKSLSDSDEERVKERLRALGYID